MVVRGQAHVGVPASVCAGLVGAHLLSLVSFFYIVVCVWCVYCVVCVYSVCVSCDVWGSTLVCVVFGVHEGWGVWVYFV